MGSMDSELLSTNHTLETGLGPLVLVLLSPAHSACCMKANKSGDEG